MISIGHRGSPGNPRYGENTIRSFDLAIKAGADALEFDVRKTKDGKLILMHDLSVKRTTNGTGNVTDLTYEELKSFDAGYGEKIPLFSEVLDRFAGVIPLNSELKEAGTEDMVLQELLRPRLRSYDPWIMISAFDADDNDRDASSSWSQLRIFPPANIPIALLATKLKIKRIGEDGFVQAGKRLGASAINPEKTGTTSSLVKLAHEEGLKVYVWTVNELAELRRLKEMGVDGVFCDFPERVRMV